jgi:outer membrane lipoprotein
MVWHAWLCVLMLVGCVACAPVISSEVRAGLDPSLPYAQIAASPEAYIGRKLILGGTIVEVRNLRDGTRLEILQYPITRRGRPRTDATSGGRFLVFTPKYLEREVYRPGRAVTVAGRLAAVQSLPLGETVYTYPQLEPQELHLWEAGGEFPQLHFSFGFGFSKSF